MSKKSTQWFPPGIEQLQRRIRARRLALSVGAAVGAIVVLLAYVVPDLFGSASEWDKRVLPLVRFVEKERGLTFDYPVAVDLLTPTEYSKLSIEPGHPLTDLDRHEQIAYAAWFRSFGLVDKGYDFEKGNNLLSDEGTLAFYDSEVERIRVRGTRLAVDTKVTIVHELTHALQDQHFDLARSQDFATSGEDTAWTALGEGDAISIENAYIGGLSDRDADAYYAASEGPHGGPNVPAALDMISYAPYALGQPMVDLLLVTGNGAAVDRAFDKPPRTEENVIDPFTYLHPQRVVQVPAPRVKQGEQRLDTGDMGAISWYVILAGHIDPHLALGAVDGWGGDAYLTYKRRGVSCVRAAFEGDTPADTAEMEAALGQWAKARPPGAASLARLGRSVVVDSCASDQPESTNANYSESLALPAVRIQIEADLIADRASQGVARCAAEQVVGEFSIVRLADAMSGGPSDDPDVKAKIEAARGRCKGPN